MYEPPVKKIFHYKHSFEFDPRNWAHSIRLNRPLAIFTAYLFFMYLAVEIASPFYTVYMIRDLNIDYFWFSALTILGAAVRIVSFRHWGRLEDKFGSRNILLVTGFFGCFTPFLWLFVSNIPEIALVKIFDGFIWAGFDLVVFNYLLDITPADKRPQYVANHNFFVGLGVTAGGLLGAYLAYTLEGSSLLLWNGLQLVFLISFVMRILVLSVLSHVKEVDISHSKVYPVQYVFWQSIAVEPAHGIKNALHYTFRYPEIIVKEKEKIEKKITYKMKVKGLL
jgi:MFS family permease